MTSPSWKGASWWMGAGVAVFIHVLAAWLVAHWQLPRVQEGLRSVSVLVLPPAEPLPPTPPPRKKPAPGPPPPPASPPSDSGGQGLAHWAPDPASLPRLSMPEIRSGPELASLSLAAAPRPQAGIDLGSLPERIQVRYTVRSSLVDGRAEYDFRRQGARYLISGFLEADGFFAQMFAGRFEQESEGTIAPTGLVPTRFSLKRGEAQAEVATFDRLASKVIHQRIRGEHVQALEPGAQDLQSFIFQFGPEFARQPGLRSVRFAITNARKMDRYEFEVKGHETIQTVLGRLETLHLVRRADDPADAYEAWLSPRHQYLPVRLRYLLGGRFLVEQDLAALAMEP